MRVGIVGSGLMGSKLGTLFARAGHHVTFSYSHSNTRLERLAREAGHQAAAATVRDAIDKADAVLLAIHWSRVSDVLKQAEHFAGKVVISCCLPMNAADTELVVAHTSSGAEVLAKRAPRARIVSAFGTVPSEVLFDVYAGRRRKPRPSLVYCGDNARAKTVAARLIHDVGFDPVDAGPLMIARYAEPFTMLVAQLAYAGKKGPRMAYRLEWHQGRH